MTGSAPFALRQWTSPDGLALSGRDYAAAPGPALLPVVCLHGLTRNSRDFETLAPWLAARGRRVLALDMRGRGLSARDPAQRYDVGTYVADVCALLDDLGIARAVFIGTSMGGLITVALATHAPARVAAAVINDIGPELSPRGLARIAGYVGKGGAIATWDDAAKACATLNADVFPHYGAADWLAMACRLFREDGGAIVADYDPAIAQAFGKIVADPDPWGKWHAFAQDRPVLVLRGTATDLLDEAVAQAMVAGKPQARLAAIAGIGHAPMMDEPDSLAALEAFFATLA
ncbi:pimeloyl-ACP methyl ester carboxylesterase [Novosphingobium capsulatum]|uniref:Pimeloyl-ACP methyl ester carboxylesterase n=1 Tax=Novosphingobium capsulatum TaxID=13688 RepID=A0ABU1MLE2_9SPHN|nr:alpha/beta hydrolase [Novosphingobium capsulatum]MDR6511155.1 pimeloyl-ACP methyl ester carboxylesterase [Novosphingobium capsulatum]